VIKPGYKRQVTALFYKQFLYHGTDGFAIGPSGEFLVCRSHHFAHIGSRRRSGFIDYRLDFGF
jgi:hypothetical protein